jgi:hypothetical protein
MGAAKYDQIHKQYSPSMDSYAGSLLAATFNTSDHSILLD